MYSLRSLLFICIAVLFVVRTQAQLPDEGFQPGYVITLKGDTLKGSIDYQTAKATPVEISFRNGAEPAVNYTPQMIKGFGVNGNNFIGSVVKVESGALDMPTEGFELKYIDTPLFLQLLVDGPKPLYGVMLVTNREQFYVRNGDVFELLGYKKYLRKGNGETFNAWNKMYLNQLTQMFKDCDAILGKLEKVPYKRDALTALFLDYYACIGKNANYQAKVPARKTATRLLIGYTFGIVNVPGEQYEDLDFSNSHRLFLGVQFDLNPAHRNVKYTWPIEIAMSGYKSTASDEYYFDENNYGARDYTVKAAYLKINTMYRQYIRRDDRHLFYNFGISNGFSLGPDFTYEQHGLVEGLNYNTNGSLSGTSLYEITLLAGVGTGGRRLTFEVRYESRGISANIHAQRFHFLLGYKL